MKHFLKNKGKRLTATVLSAVMCLMALPMSAFAFTAEEGKSVEAYYGSYYLGSDGEYYRSADYDFIAYDSNGNTSLHAHDGGGKRAKLMIRDGSGERQLMCIESGVDYNAGGSYESTSGKNSSYFQNLPVSAQYGIMLTSLYGWQPGMTAPIGGTNEDDFSIATQTIMWEYQQQLRISPTTLQANSYGVRGDTYFSMIQGRPAEQCYNWILEQMKTHSTVPSFASNQAGSAQTYTLKYNQAQDNYSLTLTDTNNLLTDIHFTSDKGIIVTRNGNEYTFTSKKMIENAVSLSAQKSIPNVVGNLLIWGGNAIAPREVIDLLGVEGYRYYFMTDVAHGQDGAISFERMAQVYNADLANSWGNLVSRTLNMSAKYFDGCSPARGEGWDVRESPLRAASEGLYDRYADHMKAFDYQAAARDVMDFVAAANLYIENSAPWSLAKQAAEDPAKADELAFVIWGLIEAIRIAAALLAPFTPATSAEVARRIGEAGLLEGETDLERLCAWGAYAGGCAVEKGAALFPRLAEEDIPGGQA